MLAGFVTALYSTLQSAGNGAAPGPACCQEPATVTVEGQPLAANIERLAAALTTLEHRSLPTFEPVS